MKNCYIVLKSSTMARRAEGILQRGGFGVGISRLPLSLSSVGCGYAIKIAEDALDRAIALLVANSFYPSKVYCKKSDNRFYEVSV